jgi:hypothetical protein
LKKYELTGGQFWISGGICFLVVMPATFAIEKLSSKVREDRLSIALYAGAAALLLATYLAVHIIPPRFAIPLGLLGWLTIPAVILVRGL